MMCTALCKRERIQIKRHSFIMKDPVVKCLILNNAFGYCSHLRQTMWRKQSSFEKASPNLQQMSEVQEWSKGPCLQMETDANRGHTREFWANPFSALSSFLRKSLLGSHYLSKTCSAYVREAGKREAYRQTSNMAVNYVPHNLIQLSPRSCKEGIVSHYRWGNWGSDYYKVTSP